MLKQTTQGKDSWTQGPASGAPADHLSDPLQGSGSVEAIASEGVSGQGGALPHLDRIQQSFGAHDVSSVRAHTDGAAQSANAALGSRGFATGDRVALAATDLHTVAHEAAHTVQQRAGVHAKSDHGLSTDPLERHADAVADKVVAGESAEGLLNQMSGSSSAAMVQPKLNRDWGWTQGITFAWKEGAQDLWRDVDAGFNGTFLPLMGRVDELKPLPERFQKLYDDLAVYRQYDNTNISMDQGRTLKSDLLPLLDEPPLDQTIQEFKAGYVQRLAQLKGTLDNYRIGAKSEPYKQIKAELSELQKRVRAEHQAPTFDEDLQQFEQELQDIKDKRKWIQDQQEAQQQADRAEREQLKALEAQQAEQARVESERRAELSARLRTWRGSNIGPQMLSWLGSDAEQEPFIAAVPKSDVGRLAQLGGLGSNAELLSAIQTAGGVKPVLALKDKPGASAARIDALLGLSNIGREAELMDRCGSMEHAINLLGRCSVVQAISLMALAGDQKEQAVHSLLALKNDDVDAVQALLDTKSGRGRAGEVLTALTGDDALNEQQSAALLATPGMAGTPAETKQLMTNAKVLAADGLTTATELLSEKANADDVLKLLTKVSVADAKTLSKGLNIHGTGAEVLWMLNQSVSVPETKRLLDHESGAWGKKALQEHGHPQHNIVHINDSLDNGKPVWTGEVCGTPTFKDANDKSVTEAHVTGNVGPMDPAGGNYHSRIFGNTPNDDKTMLLPRHGEQYREYDLKPWVDNNRGTQRIVLGSKKFYTGDHYASFRKYG